MKKLVILAAFGVAGLVSAKDTGTNKNSKEEKTEKKSVDSKEIKNKAVGQCMQVGLYVWCTDEMLTDVICWGEGTGTATYEQAVKDEIRNSQLLTEYICG